MLTFAADEAEETVVLRVGDLHLVGDDLGHVLGCHGGLEREALAHDGAVEIVWNEYLEAEAVGAAGGGGGHGGRGAEGGAERVDGGLGVSLKKS